MWEAFVSGPGKPVPAGITQHPADAADTFALRFEASTLAHSDVTCAPSTSFNLAAAAAMYAGLTIAPAELRAPLQVYRT